MAIAAFVRAAVTISFAGALSISEKVDGGKSKWPMETDLPRTVLASNNSEFSGCGKNISGYFLIESLMWESTWLAKVSSTASCANACDKNEDCVGFSSRKPTGGKPLQCHLYRGLHKKLHRGNSFVRCMKGFECQKGLGGFKFSHAGTWRDGKMIEALADEPIEQCAVACKRNRACVGFTHYVGTDDDSYCFHFENEDNKEGPKRDMRTVTYSKCTHEQEPIPHESMVLLRQLASKKDDANQSSSLLEQQGEAPVAASMLEQQSEVVDGEATGAVDEEI
ncbi:unnamed protein product [Prorocentrum cordatum]|uniref:Apple domain-containing protein n=1 Tax=Prorocentrum cordatum TaxID=2364126 RepID=A0ABN9Y7R2_9DINO|nr:unnamed protein product [Polarella glacialis]